MAIGTLSVGADTFDADGNMTWFRESTLEVPRQSIVVLAGLPGAGKTTTLRRLADARPQGVLMLDSEEVAGRLRILPVPYRVLRPLVHAVHLARVLCAATTPAVCLLTTDPMSSFWRRLVLHLAARCTRRSLDVVLIEATVAEALHGQQRRGRPLSRRRMQRHVRRWRRLRDRPDGPSLVASCAVISRAEAGALKGVALGSPNGKSLRSAASVAAAHGLATYDPPLRPPTRPRRGGS